MYNLPLSALDTGLVAYSGYYVQYLYVSDTSSSFLSLPTYIAQEFSMLETLSCVYTNGKFVYQL